MGLQKMMISFLMNEPQEQSICDENQMRTGKIEYGTETVGTSLIGLETNVTQAEHAHRENITRRYRKYTKKPRRLECTQCGNMFVKREHLNRHKDLVHSRKRPYFCNVCDGGFGTKQNMETHFSTKKHRKNLSIRQTVEKALD